VSVNRKHLSERLNESRTSDSSLRYSGRLFHADGPAQENALLPAVVSLHQIAQIYTYRVCQKSDTLVNNVNIISHKLKKHQIFTLFEQFQHSLLLIHRGMCGATEIAGLDNDGPTKMQGWTLQDWTLSDRFGRGRHGRTGQ